MTDEALTRSTFGSAWSASRGRAPEADLRAWLRLGLSACDTADQIAMHWFRRDVPTSTKPDRTFVTEADQAIERVIRERIRAVHPDHGLVGEEYGEEDAEARIRWYIDPIDGTHNFLRGVPLFGTLLAVEVDGELQVGILSAPALGERWHAARGLGAWAVGRDGVGRPVRTSAVARIDDAQLLYGSRRENVASGLMPGFDATIAASWRDRGFGDFWGYALVAEGAAEAMIECGMHTWDVAAPLVLIEEAGGRVTDVTGARRIDAPSFVGSNGHLHAELLRRLTTPG
jgi:histidinol-phosphatase